MSDPSDETTNRCGICGEPMPPNEQMFKYHGFSGPCPKPPLKAEQVEQSADWWMERADREGDHAVGAVGGAVPMSDLSDDPVRETAERLIQNLDEQGECDATDDEVEFLAREVLALRERVAASERGLEGRVVLTDEDYAALIRQRDEAVAVAREAVETMEECAETGFIWERHAAPLRARLAALTETKGNDDAATA